MYKEIFSILACFVISIVMGFSQENILGKVLSKESGEALPYVNIVNNVTSEGFITNIEGDYKLPYSDINETVTFSFIGFISKKLSISEILASPIIKLDEDKNIIDEIMVVANNDYLYDAIESCRKAIKKSPEINSKAYLQIETESNGLPTEMVQAFYNAEMKNGTVENLVLKNGRIALAANDQKYFVTLSTSKVLSNLDLIYRNPLLPECLLSNKKAINKKKYSLTRLPSGQSSNSLHIGFESKKEKNTSWSGEIWIDKETHEPLRLELNIIESKTKPFFPLNYKMDTIYHLNMEVKISFMHSQPNMLEFGYSFEYHDFENGILQIQSNGLLHLYDRKSTFFIPFFEYDTDWDDYRKISLIPFNEIFWQSENLPLLTQNQRDKIAIFLKNGFILNFDKDFTLINHSKGSLFESNNLKWDKNKRWTLIPKGDIGKDINFLRNDLVVQIFLDAVETNDGWLVSSTTFLDMFKSSYYLPNKPIFNSYLNIYLDICELERMKMQKIFDSQKIKDKSEIKRIYDDANKSMAMITKRYKNEVNNGNNFDNLKKWNNYVHEQLGINNLDYFGIVAE